MKRDEDNYLYVPADTDCTEVDFEGAERVIFGNRCKLGNRCTLGNYCALGGYCTLGNYCTLGDGCKLGEGCTYEAGRVRHGKYITVGNIGSESRTAYFYIDCDGQLFVRAGCWFSGMDDFKVRIKFVHGGTLCEAQYMAACQYAETVLPLMLGGSLSTLDC